MATEPNTWEERARAAKAYRIARVLRGRDEIPTDSWLDATEELRVRVAEVAKVRSKPAPSERTWQMAVEILHAMRDEP